MRLINIDSVPNQQFTVVLDNNRWQITIKEARGCMCATLVLNDVTVISGQRIVAGSPLIPYAYLQGSGNFWLLTEDDELPYWDRFDVDQQLVYMSAQEAAGIASAVLQWPILENFTLNPIIVNELIISLGA